MMTKDEMIDAIIERYKSYKNKSFVNLVDCCGMDCENCPFKVTECADGVIKAIIERFVKAEESQKAETNLEHYASKLPSGKIMAKQDYDVSPFLFYDIDTLTIELKSGWQESYDGSDPIQWLLSPYEEPKYKLNKFEYDLLRSIVTDNWAFVADVHVLRDFTVLTSMIDKGYFKDISPDVLIKEILDNCEVVEE